MPGKLPQVKIPQASSLEVLRQNVEHQVNTTIQQLNRSTGRFNNPVDAQNNTITNLPWPSQGGDAVPKKYIDDLLANMQVHRQQRTQPVPGPTVFHVIFKAAISQNNVGLLGMSFPSSSVAGTSVTGANVLWAEMGFTGGQYIQDHFPLPDDWVPGSEIDCRVYWASPSGTAAPTWSCQLISIGNGSAIDQPYNTAVTAVGTALASATLIETDLLSLTNTGLNPGDLCLFKLGRSDSGTDDAGLIELRFTIYRSIGGHS